MKPGAPSPLLDTAGQLPPLSDAAAAFDAIAQDFDARYGEWASVAAQRRAVRRWLEGAFPTPSTLLELGAGTGEDAVYLGARGHRVFATDPSPRMVAATARKSAAHGLGDGVVAERADAAHLSDKIKQWQESAITPFDGAYSNFAALNCVEDLTPVARDLASALRADATLALVLFGPLPPGELVLQLMRGRFATAFRRLRRVAPARLGGRRFSVWYHRPKAVARAFLPWFRLERRVGIGIFVPPSAAEPAISRHPRLVDALERMDEICERPLALLGDHVLYLFRRINDSEPA